MTSIGINNPCVLGPDNDPRGKQLHRSFADIRRSELLARPVVFYDDFTKPAFGDLPHMRYAPITFTGGALSSKTITKVGAFTNYDWIQGDNINITVGSGATLTTYHIANKVSNDAILLEVAPGGSGSDIAGEILSEGTNRLITTWRTDLSASNPSTFNAAATYADPGDGSDPDMSTTAGVAQITCGGGGVGGRVSLYVGNDNGDYTNMRANGDCFSISTDVTRLDGKTGSPPLYYETMIDTGGSSSGNYWMAGLGAVGDNILGDQNNRFIGFRIGDKTNPPSGDLQTVQFVTRDYNGGSPRETATVTTHTQSSTEKVYAMEWDGFGTWKAYIEGELVAVHTSNATYSGELPAGASVQTSAYMEDSTVNGDHTPYFEVSRGQEVGGTTDYTAAGENGIFLRLRYVYVWQERSTNRQ